MTKTAAWKRLVTRFRPRTGALAGLAALAAALFLSPTPAPAGTAAAFTSHVTEAAAPGQGRRRRPARPERRREQPAEPTPAQTTPAPAQTRPAPPPGLCDVDWHRRARGSGAVTAAVANGADVNQACGSGSSPLLLALEVGTADVVLALIRAGANLDYRDPYEGLTANRVITDRCDAGSLDRRVCAEVRRGFEARAEVHNNLCDASWWRSFYRQSDAQARSRMEAVMRTPGLDVNYDCGRGDRPLHIALWKWQLKKGPRGHVKRDPPGSSTDQSMASPWAEECFRAVGQDSLVTVHAAGVAALRPRVHAGAEGSDAP